MHDKQETFYVETVRCVSDRAWLTWSSDIKFVRLDRTSVFWCQVYQARPDQCLLMSSLSGSTRPVSFDVKFIRLDQTSVFWVKFIRLDQTSVFWCQVCQARPDQCLLISSSSGSTRPVSFDIKFIRLDQTSVFWCQVYQARPDQCLLMSSLSGSTRPVSFDIKFIRLDQKHVGLARQASPFLRCF